MKSASKLKLYHLDLIPHLQG